MRNKLSRAEPTSSLKVTEEKKKKKKKKKKKSYKGGKRGKRAGSWGVVEKVVLYTQQKKNLIAISGDMAAHIRPSAYHLPGEDSPGPSQSEGGWLVFPRTGQEKERPYFRD